MVIYLRNGAVIEVNDKLNSIKKDGAGNLVGITWNHIPGGVGLYYINLDDVVAICDDNQSENSEQAN